MSKVSFEVDENERLIKTDSANSRNQSAYLFLKAIDLFVSAFIATPLTVIYWIATWDIFVIYIYEKNLLLSCAITFVGFSIALWFIYLTQDYIQNLHDSISAEKWTNSFLKASLRFTFTYLTSISTL